MQDAVKIPYIVLGIWVGAFVQQHRHDRRVSISSSYMEGSVSALEYKVSARWFASNLDWQPLIPILTVNACVQVDRSRFVSALAAYSTGSAPALYNSHRLLMCAMGHACAEAKELNMEVNVKTINLARCG